MPYLFVGCGQAGSALVDDVFAHKNMSKIAHPVVFNSTIRDLQNLSNISAEKWYGVAEQHGLVEGGSAGFEEKVTGGFGRNPVQADEVMHRHADSIVGALEEQLGRSSATVEGDDAGTDVPFAFIFVGLGGGTGCGIAPYIAEAVRVYTNDVAEIIAIAVLPNTQGPIASDDEEEATPSRQAWNARYGLDRLETAVDGIVLVDNQRLAYHDAAEGQFTEYNEFVASGIVDLISGPILERIDRSDYDVDPPIIDLQDIVTSLSLGSGGNDSSPGYATLCRSVMMTKSLSGYLLPFVGRKEITATDLWDRARLKQTLEDTDLGDAQKALGLLRAPNRYVRDTNHRIDTSKFRSVLTAHCNELNLGVTLTKRNLASFTALLTYDREDVARLSQIERLAEQYSAETEEYDGHPSEFESTTIEPPGPAAAGPTGGPGGSSEPPPQGGTVGATRSETTPEEEWAPDDRDPDSPRQQGPPPDGERTHRESSGGGPKPSEPGQRQPPRDQSQGQGPGPEQTDDVSPTSARESGERSRDERDRRDERR